MHTYIEIGWKLWSLGVLAALLFSAWLGTRK